MAQRSRQLLSYPSYIALIAFVLRMGVLCYVWSTSKLPVKAFLPYGYELGKIASSIAAGKGFSSPLRFLDTGPSAWFTPLYPYLVAGIFKIWGIFSDKSKMVIETLNCAFASLTVIPIYGIAQKAFGKNAAAGAAWAWVLLPTALFFPITWIWDTSCAALFLALMFWATLELRGSKSVLAWAGYGALCVTGVLVNPSLLSIFPFLAGWALWPLRRDTSSFVRCSVALLLLFFIGLVPWTVRNYRVFGKFIVLRSNFGLELWLGNNPNVPDSDVWSAWLHPNDDLAEAAKYARMGEIPYMEEKEREAFAFMRTHPAETLNFTFHRFVENWLAETDSPVDVWSHAPLYIKAFLVLNILISLATWLGAMFLYRSHHPDAFPFVTVPLIFPVVFYLTHSSLRYRFPMDPIMLVLSAYAVVYLLSLWRNRRADLPESTRQAASLPTA
jgi:hypothetical protein